MTNTEYIPQSLLIFLESFGSRESSKGWLVHSAAESTLHVMISIAFCPVRETLKASRLHSNLSNTAIMNDAYIPALLSSFTTTIVNKFCSLQVSESGKMLWQHPSFTSNSRPFSDLKIDGMASSLYYYAAHLLIADGFYLTQYQHVCL